MNHLLKAKVQCYHCKSTWFEEDLEVEYEPVPYGSTTAGMPVNARCPQCKSDDLDDYEEERVDASR